MGSLRIAVALPHLGVYGGIRRFFELGDVWTRRGHEVALLTPEVAPLAPEVGPLAPEVGPLAPELASLAPEAGKGAQAWLPFSGSLGRISSLHAEAWDVLLSPDPGLFASCRAPGALRVFYSVLERAPREREALRSADLVLANSAGMLRYLERKGVPARAAAGGVNVEWFRPPAPAQNRRAERTASGEPVRVLVYGRLSRRRKGTWIAARAVEQAAALARVPVALVLFDAPPDAAAGAPAGEPGARAGAPALPRPLRIPHRWVLNPSQRELADLYRDADLFVSAERRAGWCNTAAEAMACGTAVVCTRSGTEDFAEDGVTARVARWPWSWTLARAIAPLLRDRERRLSLAARGLARIQEFSWERTADRIELALESRIGGRHDAAEAKRARS